jgi:DNA (cytosine-5)-methyltransferase 1
MGFVQLNLYDEQSTVLVPPPRVDQAGGAEYSVVSLFSGCGGMDLGFRGGFSSLGRFYGRHPFRVVWANDYNEMACRTYRQNLGDHIRVGDIWHQLDNLPARADVLIGGFPCQDISVNNGKGTGVSGKRSGLYRAMVEAIARVRPRIFVAENVRGLLMRHNSASLQQVIKDFRSLDYEVSYALYHVADYCVPQTRERVIIVGTSSNVGSFRPPVPLCSTKSRVTAYQALNDLETIQENPAINHIWSRANRSPEQGNRRLLADRPGYTIRAECHGNIQYHYSLPRRISMREAARLQSFPDDFIFAAKLRETERQIGNAVPPVFAWHIARSVLECLLGRSAR